MLIGATWLAGAAFNVGWTLRNPDSVGSDLARNVTLPGYHWFFAEVVALHPRFWIVLLILGEAILGLMTLGKDRVAQVGLVGSALWSVCLFFLLWPYTLMMGAFAFVPAWLLRYEHRQSALDLLRHGRAAVHFPG